MGITATIQNIPGGKKVILIAVSVGTEYYKPECFEALVEALLLNVSKGLIHPSTPCIVLRGCLAQRHTLEFKFDLSPEQALSLAIINGEKWENDCQTSLKKLNDSFQNFKIIRWSGDKSATNNNVYSQNQNFIVKQLDNTVECLGQTLPKFELQITSGFNQLLNNFNSNLLNPQNEDLAGLVQAAVNSYVTNFVSSLMKDNMDLVVTPQQLDKIKLQSNKYVPEDVLILNQTIEQILENNKSQLRNDEDFSICFTYPFPHGNVTENATMHVLTNKKVMKPEVSYHLKFPKLYINLGYPVASQEERRKAKEDKKANREKIKEKAQDKAVGRRVVVLPELRDHVTVEPNSDISSGSSSTASSPQSTPSTPIISPVGSPPTESRLEQSSVEPRNQSSNEHLISCCSEIPAKEILLERNLKDEIKQPASGDTLSPSKRALSPCKAEPNEPASKVVAQQAATALPTKINGLTALFLFSSKKEIDKPNALNDEDLLLAMADLAKQSKDNFQILMKLFPHLDEITIKKMAMFYTVQESAMSAGAQLPQQNGAERRLTTG
jgi:hypothetical protein